MPTPHNSIRPLVLIILDGWGIAPANAGNAIAKAKKPYFDSLIENFPHTELLASGSSVGLPEGVAGNSEVGHLSIGAGKVVLQSLSLINSSINNGEFLHNEAFLKAFDHVRKAGSNLHLLGLVGEGGVHSSLGHLYALLQSAKENRVNNVFLHLFTDGRDSAPTSGLQTVKKIEKNIRSLKVGNIASIMGRYWAMDRDKRWERTKRAYDALVLGNVSKLKDVEIIIQKSYQEGITDEFIDPILVVQPDGKTVTIKDNDGIIFFNFRADRSRQLTQSFVLPEFSGFSRNKILKKIFIATMSEYEKNLPVAVAYPTENIKKPLAKIISDLGLKQLHIGETEKYAHVTYFVNGGREEAFPLEDRIHIPSPKIATYDHKPEMSARLITEKVVEKLKERKYSLYIVNFANADMVGHTGSIEATIEAVEVLDECLQKIGQEVLSKDGTMVVTADHGNAEIMINPQTQGVETEHSVSKVPFLIVANKLQNKSEKMPTGLLADVAPTILGLMKIAQPAEMLGKNFFKDLI